MLLVVVAEAVGIRGKLGFFFVLFVRGKIFVLQGFVLGQDCPRTVFVLGHFLSNCRTFLGQNFGHFLLKEGDVFHD